MTKKPSTLDNVSKTFGYAFAGAVIGLMFLAVAAGVYALATYVPIQLFAIAVAAGAVIGLIAGILGYEVETEYGPQYDDPSPRRLRPVDEDTTSGAPWDSIDPFTTGGEE